MGGEEKDFFNRLKKDNAKIYYFPNIEVGHVIPEKRTTREYIVRLSQGVGLSEKLRIKTNGKKSLYLSYFRELVKWGATIVLWFYYAIQLKVIKGNALVLFRWNVTKRLFGKPNAIS
ncbi:MAG: hypothetical protein LBH34_01050 [Prevotellaceae bacterium]|jgi:hypothetical protein|nr:hypothetical protein [Prevotellaceae bacterium]